MDKSFIKLVEEFNSYSIDDIRDKIRTKIYKELEKLRKYDDQFSKRLEREETNFWCHVLENEDSNLKNLVKLYDSLNSLRFEIDRFKDLVNTDSKNNI